MGHVGEKLGFQPVQLFEALVGIEQLVSSRFDSRLELVIGASQCFLGLFLLGDILHGADQPFCLAAAIMELHFKDLLVLDRLARCAHHAFDVLRMNQIGEGT